MSLKKIGVIAAGAVAVGGVALGGATIASAAPAPSPSASADADGRRGGGNHTEVTGDEAAKVTAAVTAKDSAVTVTKVLKDEDGSYDVVGTKAGAPVRFEVSADLKTVTEGRGGPGGRGGMRGTVVTGDEAAKVSAAVKAKDSAVTVSQVRKSADGSYHVHGTKAGAPVHFEVSADLKTVTEGKGGPGGHRGGPRPSR